MAFFFFLNLAASFVQQSLLLAFSLGVSVFVLLQQFQFLLAFAAASISLASLSAVPSFSFFRSHQDLLQQHPVTRLKILSIDFEASSFDGITKSTSRGSELVSTIAKIGIFNF